MFKFSSIYCKKTVLKIKSHLVNCFKVKKNQAPLDFKQIYLNDVDDDGSIQNELIFTQYFPLATITLIKSKPATVCISGDGFQRVQIRISVPLFLDIAKKIKEKNYDQKN